MDTFGNGNDASPYVPWGMGFPHRLVLKGDGTFADFRKIELIH